MKISVVQFAPVFEDKQKNVSIMDQYLNKIDSDMIIFPELSTTGYFFVDRNETKSHAEPMVGETVSHFQNLATARKKIIVFGFIEKDRDKIYNSIAIVFPDSGKSTVYRKSHLFYKERFCFDPGDTGLFVIPDQQNDLNIGPMICYDWRFPEVSRTLALKGADLIICPSNLVTNVWHKVFPARAIENKVYLAVANRVGTEQRNGEELLFKGESAIYNFNGEPLCKAGFSSEEIITSEIFPEKTRNKSFNEFNDLFTDRRPELYL